MTLTCMGIEHAQLKEHSMALLGVADQKAQFVAFVVLIKCLEAKIHHSLSHIDFEIWQFLCGQQQNRLLYLLYMVRRVIIVYVTLLTLSSETDRPLAVHCLL